MNKRIGYIDTAKGIAIIAVVCGHYFQYFGERGLFYNICYSFHMPLFFLLSGMFISNHSSCKKFIENKIRKILVPYLITGMLFVVLNTIRLFLKERVLWKAINNLIKYICIVVYGSGSDNGSWYINFTDGVSKTNEEVGMLWFLLALFWGSVIVRAVINRKYSYIYVAVIGIVGYLSSRYIWLPFSIQNGMVAAVYLYLGYLVRHYGLLEKIKLDKKNCILVIGTVCIWIFSIINGRILMFSNYYKEGIIDFVGSLCGCYVVLCICKVINRYNMKWINWFGRNTLTVLCAHYIDAMIFYFITHRLIIAFFEHTHIDMNFAVVSVLTIVSEIIVYAIICVGVEKIKKKHSRVKDVQIGEC